MAKNGWKLSKVAITGSTRSLLAKNREIVGVGQSDTANNTLCRYCFQVHPFLAKKAPGTPVFGHCLIMKCHEEVLSLRPMKQFKLIVFFCLVLFGVLAWRSMLLYSITIGLSPTIYLLTQAPIIVKWSRSTIGRGGDVTNVSPFWKGMEPSPYYCYVWFDGTIIPTFCNVWWLCMATNISVQYNGGFLPDTIL